MAENDDPRRGPLGALRIRMFGVPAWAWGLGLGAGLVGFRMWRERGAIPEVTDEASGVAGDPTLDPATGLPVGGADYWTAASQASGSGSQQVLGSMWAPTPAPSASDDNTASVTPRAPSSYTTNSEWAVAATDWARIEQPTWSPLDVQAAIGLYLDGAVLSQRQYAIVNTIIRTFGVPPDLPPSPRVAAPAPASNPTAPITAKPGKPGTVKNLRTSAVTRAANGGYLTTLSWAPPGGSVHGYGVERSLDGGKSWVRLSTVSNSPYTAAVSATVPATLYRVAAYNAGGTGPGTVASARPPASSSAARPAAAPTTAPAPAARHTIRLGDTLYGLSQRYYGKVTTNAMRAVAAANGFTLTGSGTNLKPSRWQIGQVVVFPAASTVTF